MREKDERGEKVDKAAKGQIRERKQR